MSFDENDRAKFTPQKLESLTGRLSAKKLIGLIEVIKEFKCAETMDETVIKAHERCIKMKK